MKKFSQAQWTIVRAMQCGASLYWSTFGPMLEWPQGCGRSAPVFARSVRVLIRLHVLKKDPESPLGAQRFLLQDPKLWLARKA